METNSNKNGTDDAMETEDEERGSGSLFGSKPSSSQNVPPPAPTRNGQAGSHSGQSRSGRGLPGQPGGVADRPDWAAGM